MCEKRYQSECRLRFGWIVFLALTAVLLAQSVPLDALMRGGRIHYQGGRYERAREQFQKALAEYGATADNNTLAEIHLWLGLCEAQLKQMRSAAEHFLLALEKDSTVVADIHKDEQAEYWVWTALITASRESYGLGEFEKAIKYAHGALLVEPSKAQTYSIIANAYSALGQYEEMRRTAEKMLSLNTASAEAYSLIGLYFLQKPDSLFGTSAARRSRWDSTRYYYEEALKIYRARLDSAEKELANLLKTTDTVRLHSVASELVERQRFFPPEELKRYIEKDLGQAKQLQPIAQVTSRLFYAANNLNVTLSRLGSAMLRASAEVKGDTAERYRVLGESLFTQALRYDRFDYSTVFNLGIAQYQGGNDSLAMESFRQVITGTVVPIAILPAGLVKKLLEQIPAGTNANNYLELTGDLLNLVDSTLFALGYRGGSYSWFYFSTPDQGKGVLDTSGVFLSTQNPGQLENIYLLFGISQTGFGLSLLEQKKAEAGKALLKEAIGNLAMVTRINPKNAEAYLNLVHCYRETGDKDKAAWAYEMYKKLSKK